MIQSAFLIWHQNQCAKKDEVHTVRMHVRNVEVPISSEESNHVPINENKDEFFNFYWITILTSCNYLFIYYIRISMFSDNTGCEKCIEGGVW
jgi:hypothetical protein